MDMKTSKRIPPGTPKYHRLTDEKRTIIEMLRRRSKITTTHNGIFDPAPML